LSAKKKPKKEIAFYVSENELKRLEKSRLAGMSVNLAKRSDRFFAKLIDFSPVILGATLYFFIFDYRTLVEIIFGVLTVMVFEINRYLFLLPSSRGQTIGKYFMEIRIVDAKVDERILRGSDFFFRQILILISCLFFILIFIGGQPQYSLIPFLLILIDGIFIFRKDRRCLHDLMAGTKVVS
jgi:uncharacterized RDD family membrane protein YckC